MKKLLKSCALIAGIVAAAALSGCGNDDAAVANENIKKAADNFEINRRIVFFNGITDSYLLTIEGRCSFEVEGGGSKVAVICKIGDKAFKRHTLGLSDNVSFFSEQLDPVDVSVYHYRVTFKPQSIIRDIDFRGSTTDLPRSQN